MANDVIRFAPDINNSQVAPETMVANTNKEIAIPADATSVHIYNALSSPIYVRVNKKWTAVPSASTYVAGGFIPPTQDMSRILFAKAPGAGQKLDLITAGAGDIYVEFYSA